MDVLGVQRMKIKKHENGKRCKKGVKVVYISTPMKVKTCASKFRALVQELTGKDSDADAAALQLSNRSSGVETSAPPKVVVDHRDGEHHDHSGEVSAEGNLISNSPTISDAAMKSSFDDFFMHQTQKEGSFLGMFTTNFFHHDFNFQLDHALKSFDSV